MFCITNGHILGGYWDSLRPVNIMFTQILDIDFRSLHFWLILYICIPETWLRHLSIHFTRIREYLVTIYEYIWSSCELLTPAVKFNEQIRVRKKEGAHYFLLFFPLQNKGLLSRVLYKWWFPIKVQFSETKKKGHTPTAYPPPPPPPHSHCYMYIVYTYSQNY